MSLVAEKPQAVTERPSVAPAAPRVEVTFWPYVFAVVIGLLLLDVFGGLVYAAAVALLALGAFAVIAWTRGPLGRVALLHTKVDRRDLVVLSGTYLVVVALYRIAFVVIEGQDMLLFAFFAAGLLVGVGVPVIYTVWRRGRSLKTLGVSTANLPRVALLALLFAAVQFSITFWGYRDLPAAKDVATLGAMALMVGVFETVFFRGFVQGRLEASFGTAPAVFGAALLYGAYHVGYGMGPQETALLFGLGIIYALAYATTNSFFIMWPLLTPVGSLFAQFDDGELLGRLPWAALLGFADVIAVMAVILWIAHRHERKRTVALNEGT